METKVIFEPCEECYGPNAVCSFQVLAQVALKTLSWQSDLTATLISWLSPAASRPHFSFNEC
jgi:hypothetical protein